MITTLVIHTGGIGDFILACPAIAHLAQDGPVDCAGYPDRIALAIHAGTVRKAYSLSAIHFESVFHRPSHRLREFAAAYDRALVWMRDDDGAIARGLRDAGIADVQSFPGVPPEDWTDHASHYYAQCVGLAPPVEPLRIDFDDVTRRPNTTLIAPGSGKREKNAPLERFMALAGERRAQGHTVEWVFGPAELENDAFTALRNNPNESTHTPEHLHDTARLFASTSHYIGNDSGTTHLAAACGLEVTAFFHTTDAKVWAPLGAGVIGP